MGEGSKIEWTETTWNPLAGCEWASEGCDRCYAARDAAGRLRHTEKYQGLAVYPEGGGPALFTGEVRTFSDLLDQPLRWSRPRRVFVNSTSDLFHRAVPGEFIVEVFARMAVAERHTFQVLTKRPQRMADLTSSVAFHQAIEERARQIASDLGPRRSPGWLLGMPWPLPNVWLGTSIESDRYAWRADHVRRAAAAVRWISAEPLLGPLPSLDLTGIDWIVVGGESGPGARPMEPRWALDLYDAAHFRTQPCEIPDVPLPHSVPVDGGGRACACAYPDDPVAFFLKQLGYATARRLGLSHRNGGDITESAFPRDLAVREYPGDV